MRTRWMLGCWSVCAMAGCHRLAGDGHDRVLYVRHDGADMMAWVRGRVDSGVLIVVIHGGPGGESTTYVEDLYPLEQDYGVVYWDQRSSGSSRGSFGPSRYTYPQFGDDLGAVVDALHEVYAPDDLFLLGHSFGVEVGTEYLTAEDRGGRVSGWMPVNGTFGATIHAEALCDYIVERVDALLAGEGGHAVGDEDLDTWLGWRQACGSRVAPRPMTDTYLHWAWDRALTLPVRPIQLQPYRPYYPDWWSSPHSARRTTANEALVYDPIDRAYVAWERGEALADVTLPVQLMWGRWDPIIPLAVGEAYRDRLGTPPEDKALVVFDRSWHSPMLEEQDRFVEAVRDFVERVR